MSLLLLDGFAKSAVVGVRREGVVQADGKVVYDGTGIFHPLGVTWFPGVYMLKYEPDRLHAHLKWMQSKGFDYVRSLGECDWTGRSWGPDWPDYVPHIQAYTDLVYDYYGMRVEWTIVGGRQFDKNTGARRFVPVELAHIFADAMRGREHKVMHFECANEFNRLDKVSMDDLIAMGTVLSQTPNLTALSRPKLLSEATALAAEIEAEDDEALFTRDALLLAEEKPEVDPRSGPDAGFGAMKDATKAAGCHAYTLHPRRSDNDFGWSHVRQTYDFKDFPGATWNNEPEGPGSSVESLTSPLQLACCRLLGIMCGGAGYVLHVGQGVLGQADPTHNRPENMWQVENIDYITEVVRGVDALIPEGIENWRCVNNARDDHPMPLDPHAGFWEGSQPASGVNKNYSAIGPNGQFIVFPIGVRSFEEEGPVDVGTPIYHCEIHAYNPETRTEVGRATVAAGQPLRLPGRSDTMKAYWIRGQRL